MKLICFGFYSITRNKWRYISDKSMLTRIKIFTRSSLGSSSSFIRLFCLITLIPLIYLITLYKFIYGVDLSWTRLDQSPAILHDLALILDLPHRSNSCLLLFPLSSFDFRSKFSGKEQVIWSRTHFILLYRNLGFKLSKNLDIFFLKENNTHCLFLIIKRMALSSRFLI